MTSLSPCLIFHLLHSITYYVNLSYIFLMPDICPFPSVLMYSTNIYVLHTPLQYQYLVPSTYRRIRATYPFCYLIRSLSSGQQNPYPCHATLFPNTPLSSGHITIQSFTSHSYISSHITFSFIMSMTNNYSLTSSLSSVTTLSSDSDDNPLDNP